MDAVSYAHSAKQAKRITGLIRIGETEPTEVELGTEWYVPSTGKTYKYINDGSNDVWVDVGSSGANAAIKQSEEFVVGTASGNYDGNSLNTFPTQYGYYTDYVLVVLNGKILAKDDFTATDGYNVVLAENAVNGDIVEVIAFGTFVVADHYTKSEIDAINSAQDSVIAGKALLGGSATQRFKVADAVNDDEATNKGQLDTAIAGAGKVLQVASVSNSSEIVSTATIPQDSTIPNITEGVEILSLTFTPKSATSTLYIKVNAYGNEDANEGDNIVFPVFEDSLCIGVGYLEAYGTIKNIDSTFFSIKRQKGDTAQATYSVRAGLDVGTYEHLGTTDYSLGTDYGGLRASTLEIWEVEA